MVDLQNVPTSQLVQEIRTRHGYMLKPEKRVIFLGPPGCGKGTQSSSLRSRSGLAHLSTGDMLRDAVAAGTDLGKKAKSIMDKGELVGDDIVLGLVRDKILEEGCINGFILDGFPRSLPQAEGLNVLTKELGCPIDIVVYFDIADSLLIERVTGRRIHLPSGRTYHVKFSPPQTPDIDDVTGEPLTHRIDDNEETLKKRLEVYHQATQPLVDYYSKLGLLHRVDASMSPHDVQDTILVMLGYYPGSHH